MQFLSVALPLAALVSGAFANPLERRGACTSNACLAAVTGSAALGDASLRSSHCASFLATTVTPAAITVTETVTGDSSNWKRASVTVCPNEVPNYASACDEAAYTSACSCFGFTEVKTTTIAPTTTTKTVYVAPTGVAPTGGACATVTKTATTVVVSGSTCPAASTVTKTSTYVVASGSTCPAASTVTRTSTYVVASGSTCPAASTVTKTSTYVVASGSTCPAASTTTVTKGGSGYVSATTVTVTVATATVTATTVTKTVGSGYATATTVTVTVNTGTVTATTVTVTKTSSASCYSSAASTTSAAPSSCNVDDALATTLVNNFMNLLEFTSYAGNAAAGIPPGQGYNMAVSNATLDPNFVDISDSINFMAGFPLGSITFANKAAFDYGQGVLQPEVTISALNIWHDCNTITWRWRLFANAKALPVTGINYMIVGSNGLIIKNYAEFDNGAWLQSFGKNCSINPVSVSSSPPALKRAVLDY